MGLVAAGLALLVAGLLSAFASDTPRTLFQPDVVVLLVLGAVTLLAGVFAYVREVKRLDKLHS